MHNHYIKNPNNRWKELTSMERVVGMGFIAISAVGFGMMPLFANIAYQAGATPVSVLFLRFSIAALIMLGITIYVVLIVISSNQKCHMHAALHCWL